MIDRMPQVRRFALVAAPLIGGGVALALPGSFVDADGATQPIVFAARIVAALVVWMALWWMLEPIPIYATALLPLVVIPMTGVAPLQRSLATTRALCWCCFLEDSFSRWLCSDGACTSESPPWLCTTLVEHRVEFWVP